MSDVNTLLFEEIKSEAERSSDLGDALDMKANVWLVVITFLATQTAYFLSRNLSTYAYRGQIASTVALALAGVLTLICLCPRDYMLFSPSNGVIERRLQELQEHYKGVHNVESVIHQQLLKDHIAWSKDSISKNTKINNFKSGVVFLAFLLTALAATINLITLVSFLKRPF